jgi:hypothetical protein
MLPEPPVQRGEAASVRSKGGLWHDKERSLVRMTSTGGSAADGAGFDVREQYTKYEYRIPMRDGVRLFTSVLDLYGRPRRQPASRYLSGRRGGRTIARDVPISPACDVDALRRVEPDGGRPGRHRRSGDIQRR